MTHALQLPPALGNYASGDRFWDREREVREVTAYLAGSYPIDAWDKATTAEAVAALAAASGLDLEPGSAASVHAVLGLGVPYHVQLLMDEVRRDCVARGDRRVTANDISRVYDGPFLRSAVRAHLLHLETRLRIVLGEGDALRLAFDVLTQSAVVGVTTPTDAQVLAEVNVENPDGRPATLRAVLEILEHDAYLDRRRDGWMFRSRLVRDWWRETNEIGFVAASQRGRS